MRSWVKKLEISKKQLTFEFVVSNEWSRTFFLLACEQFRSKKVGGKKTKDFQKLL
jgi:hypothetical protein